MSVEAMDGLPLPSWLSSVPQTIETVVEQEADKVEQVEQKVDQVEATMEKRGVVSPSDMTVSEIGVWAMRQDLESLKAALKLESDNKGRKTALQVLQDRIEELS